MKDKLDVEDIGPAQPGNDVEQERSSGATGGIGE
jgi:hypothetical protein